MIKFYSDAAYQAKTQTAGLAVRLVEHSTQLETGRYVAAVADNHQAEFLAFEMGLQYLKAQQIAPDQMIVCHSDSKIVVQSIEKHYVKDVRYQPILARILSLMADYPLLFVKWIPEKENQAADLLARRILTKQKA